MRELIALHNITDESEIDTVVDEIYRAIHGADGGDESDEKPDDEPDEPVAKHTPGGKKHDQQNHAPEASGEGASSETGSSNPSGVGKAPPSASSVPSEDAVFVQGIREKYLAQIGPQLAHIAENAGEDQMSVAGKRRGIDTMGMYGEWQGDNFVAYSADRAEWQNQVLADMQNEQAAKNGQEPGQDREAVVMLGLPGAGKTYLIENELNEIVDTRNYLTINADDIKGKIITTDTPPEIEGVTGTELSSMVHEESSTMRKVWEASAMAQGTNVILDVTGGNQAKTLRVMAAMKAEGYKLTIVHADVSVDEAKVSALARAANGGIGDELGRIVPESFIEGMRSGDTDVINDNFSAYMSVANESHWYRTFPLNVERQPTEQRPTELIWSS